MRKNKLKLLVIRLSSMGDIVLTSPVLRALKDGLPQLELHFLVNPQFVDAIRHNPRVDKLHLYQKEKEALKALTEQLKAEQYDAVLDLQGSMRSWRLCRALKGVPRHTFPKRNWEKWQMVNLGRKTGVEHIVERYAEVLKPFNLKLDEGWLEFPLPPQAVNTAEAALQSFAANPVAVVLGATHGTKRWPTAYHAELANAIGEPVLLLGGKSELPVAQELIRLLKVPYFDAVGKYDLATSAALMKHARMVVTHDTGLMHIAAAFGQRILSIWGSTVPGFGMTPYRVAHLILQTEGLGCRPCTKIGYEKCPKGHFKCMKQSTPALALQQLRWAKWIS